ncbi:hypothetical protein BH23ACT5_BH23ACT5_09940 [soil metagenome]
MSEMTRADRDQLAKLARQRARLSKTMLSERAKVLESEVEDQLSAEYKFDEDVWADINRQAAHAVAAADRQIADICESWGVAEHLRPSIRLSWSNRGEQMLASRRAELRKLAKARIEAAAAQAKTTIDGHLLAVETELVRDGLASADAHRFLDSMPTPEQLLPRVDINAIEAGKVDDDRRSRYWEPPTGAAADLLTPSTGTAREERRQRIARALEANPEGSDRQIARMAGVDHKTVATARGEIPTETGEFPSDGEVVV